MNDAATLSPAVPRPAHIPASAVYDFDMFLDPAYLANPHERILELVKRLRQCCGRPATAATGCS